MADFVVIVPSRERPHAVAELVEAFDATCTADTRLHLVLDDDSPAIDEYRSAALDHPWGGRLQVITHPSRNMCQALNMEAVRVAEELRPFAIGFMGDDHRPRSMSWDQSYLDVLRELGTGIVYGNDLFQGERIPTQVAMTSDIIRTLGHMAPSVLVHLFLDDYWKDLGTQAGCLRYLPDVIVEHMHPFAGKAETDAGYERVNAKSMYQADHAAYMRWKYMNLPGEVAKVRALRQANA
jgi:hypothetical protein